VRIGITGSGAAAGVAPSSSGLLRIRRTHLDAAAGLRRGLWHRDGLRRGLNHRAGHEGGCQQRQYGAATMRRESSAIRDFGFLFNASSCLNPSHFIALSAKGDIVFS